MRLPNRDDIYGFLVDKEVPLLRLLFFSRWLRCAFVVFLLLAIGVPFSLLKIWDSTPEGFAPEIKISLLDRLQSWSLLRSAGKAREAGDLENAIHGWKGAIANNPGNIAACRGYLELMLEADQRRRFRGTASQNAFWLLRLNQTNVVDLELVIETFEHYELDGLSLEVLSEFEGSLTPALERARLRAFFLQGKVSDFAQQWQETSVEIVSDPEMQLFHVTYLAGWGTPEEASINFPLLREAMGNEATQELAHRLNLSVSYTRLDIDGYRASLKFLEGRNLDRPPYHVNFWNLLSELDRESEAIDMAMNFAAPPRSAVEAMLFAEAYVRLGLRDLAFRFLQRYAADYGSYEGVWYTQAEILISEERWDDLFFLAIEMRDSEQTKESLVAYSYFLEGKAEIKRLRRSAAKKAFRSLRKYSLKGSRLGLYMASNLVEWEFFEEARDVLFDVKELYLDKLVFWELFFDAANRISSSRDILLATENIYRLRPNDFAARNNFAAVLLSQRIRPDEAISLTFQVLNQNPGNASGKINHAHALLLNERVEEAADLLGTLNEKPLIEPLKHGCYLAWLEIEFLRGRLNEAKAYSQKIEQRFLLPGDRDRFREIIRGFDVPDSSPGGI